MKTLSDPRSSSVPSSRLGRLARLGQMATGVAGNMLLAGARQLAQGKRPNLSDLLLTPANVNRVTQQLAQMRGAAMKLGQLVSMDAGDLLPPELAAILGRLRSDAQPMPQRQVQAVLSAAWGAGWQQRFEPFSFTPIAAASIGQVHRARTLDGRDLAIKIQYPGVRRSISSDVNNVASLLRLSGLIPKTLDMAPLLSEAKRQLREEADYLAEGAHLQRFSELLADAPEFVVPAHHADLSTRNVLAMSFVGGVPVESMVDASQAERDRIVSLLVGLLFRELFEFGLMQTDPNFANYRYDRATRQLILLDFGATRSFAPGFGQGYRALMTAAMAGDRAAMRRALLAIGYFSGQTQPKHQEAVLSLCEMALTPLRHQGHFDFANSDLVPRLREAGMALGLERDFWHIPPIDTLFLHRKLGGLYLLAARLKARVNVQQLVRAYQAT
ncbi:MAG: AarF/ABC1/UbiB kinase family protein [Rhodoferax sp.]|uniref:ABC1 kinase family protein n=1 Tax=Rhodoferax sp. TaxID=50421 RepID=UPI002730D743|nr:AarF/ABC1/UbiB kinase family protein [Rhodoferax sp.]MDP1529119.1 AarF/ABC1/UbiB kinase family protein [Rhodoferax sp.]MDP1945489.1 AarF/ABC1/UbiB kinase family protein [Rhodoferax sp.]